MADDEVIQSSDDLMSAPDETEGEEDQDQPAEEDQSPQQSSGSQRRRPQPKRQQPAQTQEGGEKTPEQTAVPAKTGAVGEKPSTGQPGSINVQPKVSPTTTAGVNQAGKVTAGAIKAGNKAAKIADKAANTTGKAAGAVSKTAGTALKKTPTISAGDAVAPIAQGMNVGWNGMKAAMDPFMDDEDRARLQKIEDGVKGGVNAIDTMINKPREIADTVRNIAELPKRVQDTINLVKDLPQRINDVKNILQNAKNLPDVVNAYNTLMTGSSTASTATTAGTAGSAAGTSAATAGGTAAGTAAAGGAATAVAPGVAATTVAEGAALDTAATLIGGAVIEGGVVAAPVVAAGGAVVGGGAAAGVTVVAAPVALIVAIVVAVILIIVMLFMLFAGGKNYINGLAGGSAVMAMDFNNPEDKALVERLKAKMTGCDPALVVYDQGKSDIDWQYDAKTGEYSHLLDVRLLRTLDYLTDKHRIKVGLLKTGAPALLRENVLVGLEHYNPDHQSTSKVTLPDNWSSLSPTEKEAYLGTLSPEDRAAAENGELKETISAFSAGQAMAIVQIDRSALKNLQNKDKDTCNNPVALPVEVNWQKTISEKLIRPTWDELTWNAGFLDKEAGFLQTLYLGTNGEANQAAKDLVLSNVGSNNLWTNTQIKLIIRKLKRTRELLDRANAWSAQPGMNTKTMTHLAVALVDIAKLDDNLQINDIESYAEVSAIPETILTERLKNLGSPAMVAALQDGLRSIYRATQVANMAGWDSGDLPYAEAFEARNKIRQTIQELMAMPNQITLRTDAPTAGDPTHFDEDLVVKQVITFSPEDDLDNGLNGLDVFPFGMNAVGVEGVGFDPSGKDGQYTYADEHFSHSPIDNGVFSKHGTNFIFYPTVNPKDPAVIDPFKETWDKVTDNALWALNGALMGGGTLVAEAGENVDAVTYQKFLFVAF